MNHVFTWHAEVRCYELDLQGIVNNAVYLQYFDQARVQHLLTRGIDWQAWHNNGFNLVRAQVDIEFKKSLKAFDKFYVTSTIEKLGRLKILFKQAIYLNDQTLIAKAINTIVCVNLKNEKPVMPECLKAALFS